MKVEWTHRAIHHLGTIEARIEEHAPEAARRLVRTLLRSTRRLETHPRSSRKVPEWGVDRLREIIVKKNYRVLYRIRTNSIEVLGVFDTRQDPKLLDQLRPPDL